MTNLKSTRRALFTSVIAFVLCFSMLLGTTYAWFTDSVTSTGNIIQTGTLKIDLEVLSEENNTTTWTSVKDSQAPIFNYDNWEPGYTQAKILRVKNEGSLALKWQARLVSKADLSALVDVIDVYVKAWGVLDETTAQDAVKYPTDRNLDGYTKVGTLSEFISGIEITTKGTLLKEEIAYLGLAFKMQETAGNEYQDMKLGAFDIQIIATQLENESDSFGTDYDNGAKYPVDTWDGTIDTTWYDPSNPQTAYDLSTAEQLAGLAELVSGDVTFAGVTFTLTNNLDLYCIDTTAAADGDPLTFRPIGDKSKDGSFEGVFDGNGKTISNLYQNGWDLGYEWGVYGSYGLFGNVNNATIKNLKISGSESYIEGGDTSFVAGSATGDCVFENITIEDSISATYNNGNGGIIGWSGAGNYTFKNIKIAEDCVLAGLWGSFDSSIGGIVGQAEPGATYNFENVEVSCRIDAYNDCTASYDYYNYRMCGMLIGRLEETTTIDGTNYPDTSKYNINCNNVVVNYGDWMNYHYCRATGARAARVEPGYSYGGLSADYDHSTCTAHHMELIAFDQIFGGDQYAVKGLKTYDGVTVVYPQ